MNINKPAVPLTEDMSLFDFDFKHNWNMTAFHHIQIDDCGFIPDISNPVPHYLDPNNPVTPMMAMNFLDGSVAGINTPPYRYFSCPGSRHSEDLNFASYNQNIAGGDKGWGHHRHTNITCVPHQVTTVDYTVCDTVNIIDSLWLNPRFNHLLMCDRKKACRDTHGHNYSSLICEKGNFTPNLLKYNWNNFKLRNLSKVEFGDVIPRGCTECHPNVNNNIINDEKPVLPAPSTISRTVRGKKKHSALLYPEKKPVCKICKKQIVKKYALRTHIETVHCDEKRHVCPCGKTFKYSHDLLRHHKDEKKNKNDGKKYNSLCLS